MLENLIKRLNSDENEKVFKDTIIEASTFQKNIPILDKIVTEYSDSDIKSFTEAIDLIDVNKSIPAEMNTENYSKAFSDTETVFIESVISTKKSVSISKDDYLEMINNLKKFDKLDDSEKKEVVKKSKAFLSAVNRELRKANDDNPADAMILAIVNKLCKIYNVNIDEDDSATAKYILVLKINALSKAIK